MLYIELIFHYLFDQRVLNKENIIYYNYYVCKCLICMKKVYNFITCVVKKSKYYCIMHSIHLKILIIYYEILIGNLLS